MTRKIIRQIIVFLLISLMSFLATSQAMADSSNSLTIYVLELKNLIYKNGEEASGTWIEMFDELSRETGIKFKYEFTSIPRLEKVLKGNDPGCSLTVFKTDNREQNGMQFVYIYPESVAIKIYKRADDKFPWTIDNVKERKDVKIITNTIVAVDVLKELGISTELIFNFNSIISMLKFNRVSLIAGSSLVIEAAPEFKSGQIVPVGVVSELKHGIVCTKKTPNDFIQKIKKNVRILKFN